MDAFEAAGAGGGEGGANFRGMVAVVVDDGDAVDDAFCLEAAIDPAEVAQAFDDVVLGDFELHRDGDRGSRVQNIVQPGHLQRERAHDGGAV